MWQAEQNDLKSIYLHSIGFFVEKNMTTLHEKSSYTSQHDCIFSLNADALNEKVSTLTACR